MAYRKWQEEETHFLKDKWGEMSVARIAKKINRTAGAVRVKAYRIDLRSPLNNFDGVMLSQLAAAFGIKNYEFVIKKKWIDQLHIPYKTKVVLHKQAYRYIGIDDFWKWAEKNKEHIDFSKLEMYSLGKEPAWVSEKRKIDKENSKNKNKNKAWTKSEENLLKSMLSQYKYTYTDIAKRLGRTEPSVKKRIEVLGLKERPIWNSSSTPWTNEEIKTMIQMKNDGYDPSIISETINRTALAINRKFYRVIESEEWRPMIAERLLVEQRK